jgi:hypothetical protein
VSSRAQQTGNAKRDIPCSRCQTRGAACLYTLQQRKRGPNRGRGLNIMVDQTAAVEVKLDPTAANYHLKSDLLVSRNSHFRSHSQEAYMLHSGHGQSREHDSMLHATSLPRVGSDAFCNFSVTALPYLPQHHQLEATLPQGHTRLSDRARTYCRPDPTAGPAVIGWVDDPPVLSHVHLSARIRIPNFVRGLQLYASKAEDEAFSNGYAMALRHMAMEASARSDQGRGQGKDTLPRHRRQSQPWQPGGDSNRGQP